MSMQSGLFLELHVPDFSLALDFYSRIGFQETRREDTYLVLERENDFLCFYGGSPRVQEHSYFSQFATSTKRGYGVEIVVMVDDLQQAFAQLESDYRIVAPILMRPWGVHDFRVEDPFGFYVRITERYDCSKQISVDIPKIASAKKQ